MFTLPLVDYILKSGEDERDVKNGMTSITNIGGEKKLRGRGRGRGVLVGFRLCLSCSCTGQTFPGHMLRCVFFLLQRLLVGNVALCHLWNHQA
jgi:hypothetical protein